MIQDIRNHEGKVEGILLERHARGMREKHLAENSEHAAQEHRNGNDNGSFIHNG